MANKRLSLNDYAEFHEHNLFLPTRTIYFGGNALNDEDDVVTSKTVAEVIKNLHILEHREIAPILLMLNTVGGSWDDGIIIYDLIKSLKSEVTIMGLGKVYSMGSIILQAGDKRVLSEHTSLMIHDGYDGYVGDTKSFERWADNAKKTREIMYKIYFDRMKKKKRITLAQVEELCSHDTIYSAQETIKVGLADELIGSIKDV